jgi:hypothetical protein
MAASKLSAVETLHRLFVAQLQLQLQVPDPSPAMLSVIGNFLKHSGVKPVSDSPSFKRLAATYEALPFRTDDTPTPGAVPQLPTHPAQKDQH